MIKEGEQDRGERRFGNFENEQEWRVGGTGLAVPGHTCGRAAAESCRTRQVAENGSRASALILTYAAATNLPHLVCNKLFPETLRYEIHALVILGQSLHCVKFFHWDVT